MHLRNLLFEQASERVLHINFGMCFEGAKTRTDHREYVPFRFTRMIMAALEPTGKQGVFEKYCREVLMEITKNQESVFGMVEIIRRAPVRKPNYRGVQKFVPSLLSRDLPEPSMSEQDIDGSHPRYGTDRSIEQN
jgi:phosphatidylinositol kinase/protein kinase (PI-3  family)